MDLYSEKLLTRHVQFQKLTTAQTLWQEARMVYCTYLEIISIPYLLAYCFKAVKMPPNFWLSVPFLGGGTDSSWNLSYFADQRFPFRPHVRLWFPLLVNPARRSLCWETSQTPKEHHYNVQMVSQLIFYGGNTFDICTTLVFPLL